MIMWSFEIKCDQRNKKEQNFLFVSKIQNLKPYDVFLIEKFLQPIRVCILKLV